MEDEYRYIQAAEGGAGPARQPGGGGRAQEAGGRAGGRAPGGGQAAARGGRQGSRAGEGRHDQADAAGGVPNGQVNNINVCHGFGTCRVVLSRL